MKMARLAVSEISSLAEESTDGSKHLIIDEMQDYPYLQYVILDMLFDCKMTILGDKAQTLDETVHDVCTFLPRIFGKKMRKITMNKSYRNTVQIASMRHSFHRIRMWNFLERQGKEVEERQFQKEDDLLEAILEAVSAGEEMFETAAVLTRTEERPRIFTISGNQKEFRFLYRQGTVPHVPEGSYRDNILYG